MKEDSPMASRTQSYPCRCWGKALGRWWRASAWGRRSRKSRWIAGGKRPTQISRRCRIGSCKLSAPSRGPSSWAYRSRSNRVRWRHHPRGSWHRRYLRARPPSSLSPSMKATGHLGSTHPPTSPATSPLLVARHSPGAEKQKKNTSLA